MTRTPTLRGAARPPRRGASREGSVAAAIYAKLRAEIVSLRRLPGEPLSETEISLAHGVSRTPAREAILRLATEGLVEIFPQSGTFASRIPLAALPEALIIRKSLEETTAKLAAEHATPSQILGLWSLIERQAEAISAEDQEAFHRADEDFHAALAKAAGYPGVWAFVQQVKFHIDRCRRLAHPLQGRLARARREHIAIAEGVEARDPVRAATAMAAHLDRLLGDIVEIRKLNPDYFDAAPKPPEQ